VHVMYPTGGSSTILIFGRCFGLLSMSIIVGLEGVVVKIFCGSTRARDLF